MESGARYSCDFIEPLVREVKRRAITETSITNRVNEICRAGSGLKV